MARTQKVMKARSAKTEISSPTAAMWEIPAIVLTSMAPSAAPDICMKPNMAEAAPA